MSARDLMIKIVSLELRLLQLKAEGLDTEALEEQLKSLRETAGSAA